MTPIQLKLLAPDFYEHFPTPTYATTGSAAVDLRAAVPHTTCIYPGDVKLIPTGLAMHIKDPNFCALILPRSGLGHKEGIILGNGTGLIDSDYQGEIMVSVWNRGKRAPYLIHPGDRIAQMVFLPIAQVRFDIVDDFTPTDRKGGFGSTGTA